MQIADHIDALRAQGAWLAQAAERAGLDAAVPACEPWQVKDLLRHTGYIHRWAARHITERPALLIGKPPESEALRGGVADSELLAWFRAGCSELAGILAAADPGLECATFMPAPSPLAFWARRQAHETAIHRGDAESASGVWPAFPPDFAADGIDELIMGFARRRRYQAEHHGGLRVLASDTGQAWHLFPEEGRVQARRDPDPAFAAGGADGALCGPASSLYLFLWNRGPATAADVSVSGDQTFLTWWRSRMHIRWG